MLNKNSYSTTASFLEKESSSGLILIGVSILAMVFANSMLADNYQNLLSTIFEIRFGDSGIAKPILLWINDGLMAIFFFLIGLELKREFIEGELSSISQVVLPAFGAVGGMILPALIYLYFNHDDPIAIQGWAIPAATDIAFALGILALLGSRAPKSLKILLTTIAIFDDLGAIIIIALFYTSKISLTALAVVAACMVVLFALNKRHITSKSLYVFIGVVMWVSMLKSGVHATLAGVILAFFIPMYTRDKSDSPVKTLEHDLHTLVAFLILPIFAFANAGINLSGVSPKDLLHSIPMGIALGLTVGKLLGVFLFCYGATKLKLAKLPTGMTNTMLLGVASLCGIGFTMSLFIGSLAFGDDSSIVIDERLGILLGSIISGVIGYCILRFTLKREP